MAVGRSYTYNCLDFDGMCEAYFEKCDDRVVQKWDSKEGALVEIPQPEPYLKSGLALYLGLCTETMRLYSKDRDCPFFAIIKRAYDRIQNNLEMRAIVNKDQAVGCLFNLKCNHGMIETNKVVMDGGLKLDNTSDEELDNRIKSLMGEMDVAGD